jgi:hypothetical protein
MQKNVALAGSCGDHAVDQSQSVDLVYASDTLKIALCLHRRGREQKQLQSPSF